VDGKRNETCPRCLCSADQAAFHTSHTTTETTTTTTTTTMTRRQRARNEARSLSKQLRILPCPFSHVSDPVAQYCRTLHRATAFPRKRTNERDLVGELVAINALRDRSRICKSFGRGGPWQSPPLQEKKRRNVRLLGLLNRESLASVEWLNCKLLARLTCLSVITDAEEGIVHWRNCKCSCNSASMIVDGDS